MSHVDGPGNSGSLARLSLRRLAEYAKREELIDSLDEFGDHVVITQAESRFVLPKRQASTFLIGLLHGRTWLAEKAEEEEPFASVSPRAEESSRASDQPQLEALRALDTMLDSMLKFSQEVGIIEGFEMLEVERMVRIDISACSSELSYADALAYLLDCTQHEMRVLLALT